jgi:hypothetical protein
MISASNALWRALLLSATLAAHIAPVESHGPATSTPCPILAPNQRIAAMPRQLRLRGGGADWNETSRSSSARAVIQEAVEEVWG